MDGAVLGIFLLAAFVGGLTSGVSGFALGVVLSGVWLHFLAPAQTATLIIGCGLVTQGYGVWKLRHALRWRKLAPLVAGSAIGAPLGVALLTHIDPGALRTAIGLLLVAYSAHGLAGPALRPVEVRGAADLGIGILNGLLAGLTGLSGIIVTLWCQLRGWPKDVQRAVFQPVNLATIVISAAALALAGAVTAETLELYLLALPLLAAGLWSGFRLYGKLDEAAFRKVVLVLVLVSGLALLFSSP